MHALCPWKEIAAVSTSGLYVVVEIHLYIILPFRLQASNSSVVFFDLTPD